MPLNQRSLHIGGSAGMTIPRGWEKEIAPTLKGLQSLITSTTFDEAKAFIEKEEEVVPCIDPIHCKYKCQRSNKYIVI